MRVLPLQRSFVRRSHARQVAAAAPLLREGRVREGVQPPTVEVGGAVIECVARVAIEAELRVRLCFGEELLFPGRQQPLVRMAVGQKVRQYARRQTTVRTGQGAHGLLLHQRLVPVHHTRRTERATRQTQNPSEPAPSGRAAGVRVVAGATDCNISLHTAQSFANSKSRWNDILAACVACLLDCLRGCDKQQKQPGQNKLSRVPLTDEGRASRRQSTALARYPPLLCPCSLLFLSRVSYRPCCGRLDVPYDWRREEKKKGNPRGHTTDARGNTRTKGTRWGVRMVRDVGRRVPLCFGLHASFRACARQRRARAPRGQALKAGRWCRRTFFIERSASWRVYCVSHSNALPSVHPPTPPHPTPRVRFRCVWLLAAELAAASVPERSETSTPRQGTAGRRGGDTRTFWRRFWNEAGALD
jgi:hypothetical protein